MKKKSALKTALSYLSRQDKILERHIKIPSLWRDYSHEPSEELVKCREYFSQAISKILLQARPKTDYSHCISSIDHSDKQWTKRAVIYNAFPRLTAAFDHDANPAIESVQIDLTVDEKGIRDTGTFLKIIAMLPYIKSMGVNTLYLLPVNKIGNDGRNGTLGSPYATKDLFAFDCNLADPLLGDMPVEDQFKALVEAAHILGMRVVMEFALRTASLDAQWVGDHPEWFYWIDRQKADGYASPRFAEEELEQIKKTPSRQGEYIAPPAEYRQMFCQIPQKKNIDRQKDKYVAKVDGGEAVIPGAFADWPPDDVQPAWRDVTYLRMYDFPRVKDNVKENDFNYIAYNTIRYYDPKLAKKKNANLSLWGTLCSIIPHYQKSYGIDGVMVDMGHAIPAGLIERIIAKARELDHTFAFFEENFYPSKKSKEIGYNAALGFGFEMTAQTVSRMIEYVKDAPVPIFGTLETHNTPRAAARAGEKFSKLGYALFAILPSMIPFIHSGFELLETMPVNTGIGFTAEQSEFYRSLELPMFYVGAYNWTKSDNIVDFIRAINKFREKHLSLISYSGQDSICLPHIESDSGRVICVERRMSKSGSKRIILIANTDLDNGNKFYLNIPFADSAKVSDVLTGFVHSFVGDWLSYDLDGGEVVLLEL